MGKNAFGKISTAQLELINPILKTLAYETLKRSNVDFGILKLGGLRTAEEQNELFHKGVSQLDGYNKIGKHQTGLAVDFVPYIDGKYTWANKEAFKEIRRAAKEAWAEMNITGFDLVWGGDWKTFVDMPHYELKKK